MSAKQKEMHPVAHVLITSVLVLALSVVVVRMRNSQRLAEQSNNWPIVPGIVTDTRVAVVHQRARARTQAEYIELEYEYTVDQATYRGNRVDFSRATGIRKHNAGTLAQLEIGDPVSVKVHPEDPSIATLRSSGGDPVSRTYLLSVIGLAWAGCLIGLGFGVFRLRKLLGAR